MVVFQHNSATNSMHLDDAEGITVMLTLDEHTLPSCLYFITNPLYADVTGLQYNFHHHQIH
jgi:hypothetical protein